MSAEGFTALTSCWDQCTAPFSGYFGLLFALICRRKIPF